MCKYPIWKTEKRTCCLIICAAELVLPRCLYICLPFASKANDDDDYILTPININVSVFKALLDLNSEWILVVLLVQK